MPAVFPSLMVAIVGYNGGLKWPLYFLDNYLLMAAAMWPSLLDIGSCNSDRSYFLMTCSCNGKDKSMLIVTAKPAIVP